MISVSDYIAAQKENLEKLQGLPHFAKLVPMVHETYVHSFGLVPQGTKSFWGRLLLLCHKQFLSAATLVAQAQPDDSAAITRRAIETAEVAFATKADPANEAKWLAYEQRHARWQARQKGTKPPRITQNLAIPHHRILAQLKAHWGMISDAYVHFTPEFFAAQKWTAQKEGESHMIRLMYFETDILSIKKELVLLTGTHSRILQVFDDCFEGAFKRDRVWHDLMVQLDAEGTALSREFRK